MRGAALAALVAATMIVSTRWGSFVAGGSDSYCYVHQAERWAGALAGERALQRPEPLALEAPWPDAAWTFAPAGHIPSPTVPGAVVPVCPAGLSLAMALFVAAAGPAAAFAVVPIFAGLLVVAVSALGARYGARVGLAAALATAASPVFLYQAVQPMSDVPAAALWVVAAACATGTGRRHALWAGVATSAAILVRPNLLPLGLAIGAYVLWRPERTWRQRGRAALTYALASAPGCVAVALVQQAFYGSPAASGYGSFDALFAAGNVVPNLRRYLTWLWETHTPAIALALLGPWLLPGALTTLLLALVVVNLALYLPYVQFEDWSYLRFLLPTLPLLLILVLASVDAAVQRVIVARAHDDSPGVVRARRRVAALAVATVALVLAALFVREAIDRHAFRLQALESRFARTGLFVRDRLPANALLVTSAHSGSARFYAGRATLVWDQLDPAWLERALAFVRERGYEPYLLIESGEEEPFRERFAASPLGALDWPPAAQVGAQVRLYRPGDRERYMAGSAVATEYVR